MSVQLTLCDQGNPSKGYHYFLDRLPCPFFGARRPDWAKDSRFTSALWEQARRVSNH
jgi:hypothetical protein